MPEKESAAPKNNGPLARVRTFVSRLRGHKTKRSSNSPLADLVSVEMPGGNVIVTKRSNVPDVQRRIDVSTQILRERGIDPNNIGDLGLETILAIRAERARRLDEVNPEDETWNKLS